MDVSWIPGSADLVVVIVAAAAIAGGAVALLRRPGRGGGEPQAPTPAPRDGARPAPADEGTRAAPARPAPEDPSSRLARLRSRLSGGMGSALLAIFSRGSLSADDWEELEETLLAADVGAASTEALLDDLRARLKATPDAEPYALLREALLAVVDPGLDRSLDLAPADGVPATAVVVGVNGVGKTTTVGKLARVLVAEGRTVVLGAADTFRAAAADQLETWGARVGVPVVRSDRDGADPASVAFEAAQKGRDDGADVVLVDTAGRLQNKAGLMDELGKIVRVVSKVSPPREVLLVLDATTGQNGLTQARVFGEVAPLTGIVLTKLDGTARGGIVVAVQRELGVPVKFIGLGEGEDDLAPFDAAQFVDGILGR
ncbi:signal recognition particle-docking protein FtsY [Demequina capsici]|uniref:Signal recognition particle receptor FtsY n=1 Tax=Demequina capsici TaxID=3075620 RepID=A0AA96JC19_9MICO|nr:signal recognition particle-docking protein FtsY [Demequina sp. PMTSA13]WNM26326.1 signal recognition particle-docking protein FtsY [Demequina sp. PMTSA13]